MSVVLSNTLDFDLDLLWMEIEFRLKVTVKSLRIHKREKLVRWIGLGLDVCGSFKYFDSNSSLASKFKMTVKLILL